MASARTWVFRARPRQLQAHIGVCVATAGVLPVVVGLLQVDGIARGELLTAAALIALSVINVEFGRALDGGLRDSHRPHKALSAWAFATALLLPAWWLLPVVVVSYAHARWRGLRLQLWKWVGSAAYVALAALAANLIATSLHGQGTAWFSSGPGALLTILAAAAVFLLVETVLFHGSAYLNEADDETWLRTTLRSSRFYATEAAMLLVGGLSAAVLANNPWLLPLMLPAYGLAQQAALHEPLQQQAQIDSKTGLYRYEAWRVLALAERDRCTAKGRPWSVVFADLDRFKPYNDAHGHLAGDAALAAIADLLRRELRSRDLVGRFGGEEFCLFLPDTSPVEAAEVAERLRAAVAALRLPGTDAHVSMSLGVASTDAPVEAPTNAAGSSPSEVTLVQAIEAADTALYVAKDKGRNAVHVRAVRPGGRHGRGAAQLPPHHSPAA